jgi:rpsU-divergently transcribed protein
VATGLLPGGPVELVWHVMRGAQRRMNAALAATDLAPLSVNERVALAVRARLSAFAPYGPGWASAMALGASPGALPTTLALLGAAVDDAWWAAGDRSVDLSWYTRRALLAGVSAATEVYMLTDSSPDRGDTWAFLEARLGEVRAVARSAEEAARVAAAAGAGAAAAAGAALDVARPALVGRDGEGLAGCLRGCGGSSGGSGEPAAGLLPPLLALAGRAAQGALAAAEAAGAGALGTAAGAQLPALLAALLPPAPGSGVGAPSGGGPPPPVAPTPRPASAAAPPPLRPV